MNRTIRIQAFLISKVYLEINFTRKVKQLPTYWFFLLQPWRKRSGSFVMFYICFSFMFPFFLLGYFLASFFVASHSQECLQQTIEVFYESMLKVWQFVIFHHATHSCSFKNDTIGSKALLKSEFMGEFQGRSRSPMTYPYSFLITSCDV